MIIFISDLHLMDGTGGIEYLPPQSYRRVLEELGLLAREAGAKEVTLVWLGDVFDLIRTERWFAFPVAQRPWGEAPSEAAALDLLNGVIEHNAETCALFAGSMVEQFHFPVEPRRVYIPGNHDRVCDLYPSLRRRVFETLRLTDHDPAQPFPHQVLDAGHAVFARHGQEWDNWNFGGSAALSGPGYTPVPWADYRVTPIGDLLACEISSKLPGLVRDHLPADYPERDAVYDHFRVLYDVIPTPAIVQWIYFGVPHDEPVKRAIDAAFKQAAREFRAIPFVHEWERSHGLASAELRLLMEVMEHISFSSLERWIPALDTLIQKFMYSDNYASQAAADFERLDQNKETAGRIHYVLYGHTHSPEARAISVFGDAPRHDRVYLNTGTWRPYHYQSLDRRGFMSWRMQTYTVIRAPGERLPGGEMVTKPSFGQWTGAVK